ncbi:hypothetical protein BJY00DRAFT_315023 [Aspergillus carlsbadensis]|nr:hypothetical protein BJY00DRAFT_315023 [Aspergillus carlsbadensis]
MDPISAAASVIGLIQVAASITRSVSRYAKSVGNARRDVAALQAEISQFSGSVEKLAELLRGPGGAQLATSQILVADIESCRVALTALDTKLNIGNREKAMSRVGLRALKWPLSQKEVAEIMKELERYRGSLSLAMQVDQTTLLTKISRTSENISQQLDTEKLPAVAAAEFDSYLNQHENECFPGTRTRIINQIKEWATSPDGKCIFWLNGMAGTGKSTISRTVARSFRRGMLGASFFFKRGEDDRGNAMKFISTISSQLARNVPVLAPNIRKALENHPELSTKSLKEQFEKLLLQPFLGLPQNPAKIPTILLVVDALDECEPPEDVRLIVQLLSELRNVSTAKVRLFITSRPELPVRMGLMGSPDAHHDLALHEIPEEEIREDITLFLQQRLHDIRQQRGLHPDWPGNENVKKLVKISLPLFVFASTVCRVLEDPQWDPDDSLAEILSRENEDSRLGPIYIPILDKLLANQSNSKKATLIQEFQGIVGPLILLGFTMSVTDLSRLICKPENLIRLRLDSLHSVLNVPALDTDRIRPFHLSFREFLLDPNTRGITPFWVDERAVHSRLFKLCLNRLQKELKKNCFQLPDYGSTSFWSRRRNASGVENDIRLEFLYACLFWADHLIKSIPSEKDIFDGVGFLRDHFLHWLEVICSVDRTPYVPLILDGLAPVLQPYPAAAAFLEDCSRFFTTFRELGHNVPMQFYSSALVFTPPKSTIRERFSEERPKEIRSLPRFPDSWNIADDGPTKDGSRAPGSCVSIMEFSSNYGKVAAGCRDFTIKIWSSSRGTLQRTLIGHTATILSLSFSPTDNTTLASSAEDQTIRIWDIATGSALHTLIQKCSVKVLKFSPDGQLLASIGTDNMVRIYDTTACLLEQLLGAHKSKVVCGEFSPNGELFATGAATPDGTIKIWDVTNGTLLQTIQCGQTTRSLAFSPNGIFLISSADERGRLKFWDVSTGVDKYTINLRETIRRVEFSPDGDYLITENGNIAMPDLEAEPDLYTVVKPTKENTVLLERPWVTVNGKPIMCFLRRHEPSCSIIKGDTVALGYQSGQVLVIRFDRRNGTG